MTITPRIPELLAPAGSPEAFRTAIAAGADAVYLSGKRFGARRFAANFSDNEIEEAVIYAHARGIRVYVTVNTLIHDRELAGVLDYLAWLWSIGVDAVLIQDTGLAALAREYLPDLVIHASTQLTIHNAEGVRWAREHGFSRVVLARELTLDEVTRIAEETGDTGVGLEVFLHGALCYSYSGQCLLSSVIGGRSGNRGMCAQPCRKPYALVTGETDDYGRPGHLAEIATNGKYLLSPKDLCTYRHLPDLVKSPVVSLKIEGRMKSPEYVSIVVSTYRRALDAIAAGTWKPSDEAIRDLLLAFNRGFTSGYLFGDRYNSLMGRDAPDNRGLLIGRVIKYYPKTSTAIVRSIVPVLPVTGDGLFIVIPETPESGCGFALNTAPKPTRDGYSLVLPSPVPDGASVFITSSRDLEARARRIVAKPFPDLLRPLPVDLDVTVDTDGSIRFEGRISRPDGTLVPVSFHPGRRLEPARTHPLTRALMEEQFRKTGGTPFTVRHCAIRYDEKLFAPVSVLNDLRREFFLLALESLDAASRPSTEDIEEAHRRLQERPLPPLPDIACAGPAAPRLSLSVYTDSPDGVREAVTAGARTICFEPLIPAARHTCGSEVPAPSLRDQILSALDTCRDAGALLVWKIPRISRDAEITALVPDLLFLHENGLAACMTGDHGSARAISRAIPSLALHGSAGLSVFNHRTAMQTLPPYALLTLSSELSRDEIGTLIALVAPNEHPPVFSLIVQGNSEAMITEDCLPRIARHCHPGSTAAPEQRRTAFLGIQDETGRVFPVRSDGSCRTRISNASELCLIDMLPAIREAGITAVAIDARNRPPAYTRRIIEIYQNAILQVETGTGKARDTALMELKEQVKKIALGGITAGHFIRGLRK
ncbi:MAG: DUF3656 domain-containing protein [Methanoregula sp.]